MISFPFLDVDGDRAYSDADWRAYFKQFVSNGVYPNPANGLKVVSKFGSMVLTVGRGSCFIEGAFYEDETDVNFAIGAANLTLTRIDIFVARLDLTARKIGVFVREGVPAALPLAPALVRNDDVFDLKLCEVTVKPNVTAIATANILDTRLNTAVCGIVHGVVEQADTTDIFSQYFAMLGESKGKFDAQLLEQKTDYATFKTMVEAWQGVQMTKLDTQIQTQKNTWTAQTAQQQTAWLAQTAKQQSDFIAWQATIDAWKGLTITELAKVLAFNFENQFAYPGTRRAKSGNVDTGMQIDLKYVQSGGVLASMAVVFVKVGENITKITETQTVYNPDASVFKKLLAVTNVNGDNVTTEVSVL